VLARVGKAKGQTLESGRRRTPSPLKNSRVAAGVGFLLCSVMFSFLSKQRMCICIYTAAGYKAED
jgi:hypothetical protein